MPSTSRPVLFDAVSSMGSVGSLVCYALQSNSRHVLPCKSELSVRNLNFILYKLCAVLSSDRIRHFFPTPSGYDPFLSYDHTEKVNRLVLALKILRDYTGMTLFVMHYNQTHVMCCHVSLSSPYEI